MAAERAQSTSETLDADLARKALEKRRRGETPTRDERAALRRLEKRREEEQRWQHYRSIPLRHWREMSGRQHKTLREQAEAYGIPFDRREIDLAAVARALHDFLARKAHVLGSAASDDPLLAGGSSAALERYRDEKAKLARLERLEREGQLLPRDTVHSALARIASILRAAGELLQRTYGAEAHDVLDEALSDAAREIDTLFGPDPGPDADSDDAYAGA